MGLLMGCHCAYAISACVSKLFLVIILGTVSLGAQTGSDAVPAPQTPLQFESHGLEYEALTHEGITVMYAPLPPHIKDFNIFQITVTNGSPLSWTVKPSDFTFIRQDGMVMNSVSRIKLCNR